MTDFKILIKADFLENHQALLNHLIKNVDWDERIRARKTASFGVPYNYSQIAYPATPLPAHLAHIAQQLHTTLGFLPNNCLLNYYADGNASMGFHSDNSAELAAGTGVAIISLGSTRTIVYQNKHNRQIEYRYELLSGSLLYMSGELQQNWLHAIPKAPNVGARISLTFRLLTNSSVLREKPRPLGRGGIARRR